MSLGKNSDNNTTKTVGFDPRMLESLVCPVTHGLLRYDAETSELISETVGLAFPVRDGIPIMLVDEARQIKQD